MKQVFMLIAVFVSVALTAVAAQAASGEQTFKEKCFMCHTVKGKGGKAGPDLSKVGDKYKKNELQDKLDNPKKGMPSFKSLPNKDAVIDYLMTLK